MDERFEGPSSPKKARGKEKAEIIANSQTTILDRSYATWTGAKIMLDSLNDVCVEEMQDKMREARSSFFEKPARITSKSQETSIFRVPARLQGQSPEYYRPKVVAIGPYNRRNSNLPIQDKDKWCCVEYFISERSLNLKKWLRDMKSREQEARNYYSEDVPMDSKSFLEMLLLDGCFILQAFERISYPRVSMEWPPEQILLDFLLLENQIPFFVLVQLSSCIDISLDITLPIFISFRDNLAMGSYMEDLPTTPDPVLHLLHLFHLFLVHAKDTSIDIHADQTKKKSASATEADYQPRPHIPGATELHDQSAVKFKKIHTSKMLDIRFCKGVMEIPILQIHDDIIPLVRNLIAFEHCYSPITTHLTAYATFMSKFINKESDVQLLESSGILLSRLLTSKDVVIFFSKLISGGEFRSFPTYMDDIILTVDTFRNKKWNRWFADLKFSYFSNPWVTLSVVSAAVLLILSFLQAYYGIVAYYQR